MKPTFLFDLLMNKNELNILHEKYQIDMVNWDLAMAHLIRTKKQNKTKQNKNKNKTLDLPQPRLDCECLPQGVLLT